MTSNQSPPTPFGARRPLVPGRHVHRGPAGEALGQQRLLHGAGGRALAGVAAGVVHGHGGAGDDLLGEPHVVVEERAGPLGAGEGRHAEGDAAGPYRHDHQGAVAVLEDGRADRGVLGDPGAGRAVEGAFHEGAALQQAAGDGRGGGAPDGLPEGEAAAAAAVACRRLPGAADDRGQADRSGRGFVAAHHGVQQVHGDEVGQRRHGLVGEFLRGAADVEGAADAGADVVEQGEPALGAPPFGDVDDHVQDADDGVVAVGHAEERHGDGTGVPGLLVLAAELEVHDGLAGLQHAPHLLLEAPELGGGAQLGQPPSDALLQGDQPGERFVHPHVPQVRVEHGQADGRAGEEGREHHGAGAAAGHPPEGAFRRPSDVAAEDEGGDRGGDDARDHLVDVRLERAEQRVDRVPGEDRA